MEFVNKYLISFYKLDTLLAFMVSTILFFVYSRKAVVSIKFSFCFVIIFLLVLNLVKHRKKFKL